MEYGKQNNFLLWSTINSFQFPFMLFFPCGVSTRFRLMASPYGALRSHSLDTSRSVGFLWTSDQPHVETSTWRHAANTHATGGIRTRNPSKLSCRRPTLYTARPLESASLNGNAFISVIKRNDKAWFIREGKNEHGEHTFALFRHPFHSLSMAKCRYFLSLLQCVCVCVCVQRKVHVFQRTKALLKIFINVLEYFMLLLASCMSKR